MAAPGSLFEFTPLGSEGEIFPPGRYWLIDPVCLNGGGEDFWPKIREPQVCRLRDGGGFPACIFQTAYGEGSYPVVAGPSSAASVREAGVVSTDSEYIALCPEALVPIAGLEMDPPEVLELLGLQLEFAAPFMVSIANRDMPRAWGNVRFGQYRVLTADPGSTAAQQWKKMVELGGDPESRIGHRLGFRVAAMAMMHAL